MGKLVFVFLILFAPGLARGGEAPAQPGDILRRARLAAAAMARPELKVEIFREIASVQMAARDFSGASATLREAVEIAKGMADENSRNETLIEVAGLQAKAGDSQAALKTAGFVWREGYRQSAATVVAAAQIAAGRAQEAMRIAEDSGKTPLAVSLFAQIAVAQNKAGDKSGAARTLKALALLGVAEGILEGTNAIKRQDHICRRALASEWVSPFISC